MSHVIRIPSNVFARLEEHASGFDTPVRVIERLLDHYDGVDKKPFEGCLDKKTNSDNVDIRLGERLYRIEMLSSGSITVHDENTGGELPKVKPFLRTLIDELELNVDPLNSKGNEKNTRQLGKEVIATLQGHTSRTVGTRKRKPNTDLLKLIKTGVLDEGQMLFLHNYQGKKLKDEYRATISGKGLLYEGEQFSMSALARELLQVEGFSSDSVTGPEHWFTSKGESIKVLWEEYLRKNQG